MTFILVRDLFLQKILYIQKLEINLEKYYKYYYENNHYIYKKRNLIENFFAKIKNSFSDRENTKNFNMAKKFILMKLLLVNFATLEAILLLLYFLFFKHSPNKLDKGGGKCYNFFLIK
jgi:hypothetical protein